MPREIKSVDEPLKGVSSTVEPVDNITNRLLRVDLEAAGLLVMPAIDGVAGTKRWMPSIIQDIWVRLKMKVLGIFHVKPENFKKMMQIDEKKYKQYYDRYFYQYYIKHLNAKLPEKYVDEIWNARLKYWLIKGLSVPQVADKLKGSKGIMAAGNTPSFDIIGRYNKMWGEEQVKLSSKQSGGGHFLSFTLGSVTVMFDEGDVACYQSSYIGGVTTMMEPNNGLKWTHGV
ncbi:hypothetical protein DD238_003518 [Peronospora effusa]|uniref:Uncharacterized protein n=1 Tax=Peronospora effusa TaxID=542832 RepID=A0A3M6VWF3_9STRA|nr:hypothetical protein DD238_003518 [Peronospora effusa]